MDPVTSSDGKYKDILKSDSAEFISVSDSTSSGITGTDCNFHHYLLHYPVSIPPPSKKNRKSTVGATPLTRYQASLVWKKKKWFLAFPHLSEETDMKWVHVASRLNRTNKKH